MMGGFNSDQEFARQWLARQKSASPGRPRSPRPSTRQEPIPERPARRLDGVISIYSVAIFKVHRESESSDGPCFCDTCFKVRERMRSL